MYNFESGGKMVKLKDRCQYYMFLNDKAKVTR